MGVNSAFVNMTCENPISFHCKIKVIIIIIILDILHVSFSHLREHKFKHNFADTLNPLCACALETECTEHFFLLCHNYIWFRTTLMDELRKKIIF